METRSNDVLKNAVCMIIRLLSRNFPQGGVNLTQWSHTGDAQRAERGIEVLGEGVTSSPPHQLGVWESAVSK